jgi:hypothetical protein
MDNRRRASLLAGVEGVIDELLKDDERPIFRVMPRLVDKLSFRAELAKRDVVKTIRLRTGRRTAPRGACKIGAGQLFIGLSNASPQFDDPPDPVRAAALAGFGVFGAMPYRSPATLTAVAVFHASMSPRSK